MDFIKIIDWAAKYLAEYFAVLFSTLQNPEPAYKPDRRHKNQKINPKLMGFALISIAMGATINSVIPNRPANAEVFTTSIVTLIMWIVYSIVIFSVSTVLGGKVHLLDITTISLQLFGTVYVVSNLAAFLWGIAASNPFIYYFASKVDTFKLIAENPLVIFYFVQITILTIYLPRALTVLFKKDNGRIVLVTIASILFIFPCGISPYLSVLLASSYSDPVMPFYILINPSGEGFTVGETPGAHTVTSPIAYPTTTNVFFQPSQVPDNMSDVAKFATQTAMNTFSSPTAAIPSITPTATKKLP